MQSLYGALIGVLTAGLLAGAPTPIVETADAGPPDTRPTAREFIDWKPCASDTAAECGSLRLPVDWARPTGEKFDLALARRKATDPDRRVGVLLVNPGGPGEQGVEFVRNKATAHFSADIQKRFDVIGFDPRGVGRSQPVRCSRGLLAQQPSVYPRNQAEFAELVSYNRALRQDCRRHSGPVFDHADTLSVVRDMDAIRRALGEKKINYFGHSYGTLIGQQYAEQFGDRIRAMALTANMDHSLGARDFIVSSAATAEDSFHQFVQWCDRTRSCALHGRNVTVVWDALLAKADRGEVRDPQSPHRGLTAHEITQYAFRAFYGPDWERLASYVAGLDAQEPRALRLPQPDARPGATEPTDPTPFHAVFCQDWRIRAKDYREYAKLTDAELRAAPHMRGSPRMHTAIAGCIGWPDEVNNPQHRLRITDAPTILMSHALHDPANNHAWATNAHRQTRRTTVLLTYEGSGHSVYNRNTCTRKAVDDYLLELKVPPHGSRCAATVSETTAGQ
ncbi:alpha/beta fold hydrolase [Streptomyces sp. NBC_00690]|uniref:alpha/beta fold hydrolase n=1 Tax=Streptomyces sp. NBC_00690 TaxID=2975808 RepID=UPI002E2DC538|nr:alpha/beta fold hydrolase [Streptomyces sp. NBC_00690]